MPGSSRPRPETYTSLTAALKYANVADQTPLAIAQARTSSITADMCEFNAFETEASSKAVVNAGPYTRDICSPGGGNIKIDTPCETGITVPLTAGRIYQTPVAKFYVVGGNVSDCEFQL
jgi:hypothetical protein